MCAEVAYASEMEKTEHGHVCSDACSLALSCDLADKANDVAQAILEAGPDDWQDYDSRICDGDDSHCF